MEKDSRKFRFVIDGEVFNFSVRSDEAVSSVFNSTFPKAELEMNYCQCYDRCSCVNGHFVNMEKFEYDDPEKPWEGQRKFYHVRLEELIRYKKTEGRGKNKKTSVVEEWKPYYDYLD